MTTFFLTTISYFVLVALALWVGILEQRNTINLIYVTFPLLTTLAGISTLTVSGLRGARAISLLTLTIASATWLIAEVFWTIDFWGDSTLSFPSVGDFFFLAGYLLYFGSLLIEIRLAQLRLSSLNKNVLAFCGVFALLFISLFTSFVFTYSYSPDATLWENVVLVGYNIGDMFLVVAGVILVLLAWEYRGGKISYSWLYLLAGFIFTMVADVFYAIYFDQYESSVQPLTNLVNYAYHLGYICIAFFFVTLRTFILAAQQKTLRTKR